MSGAEWIGCIAKALEGVGVGMQSTIVPYFRIVLPSERVVRHIAPMEYSGRVQTLHTVGIVTGELVGFVMNSTLKGNLWAPGLVIAGIGSIQVLLLFFVFSKELPIYYLRNFSESECGEVLNKIYPGEVRRTREYTLLTGLASEVKSASYLCLGCPRAPNLRFPIPPAQSEGHFHWHRANVVPKPGRVLHSADVWGRSAQQIRFTDNRALWCD